MVLITVVILLKTFLSLSLTHIIYIRSFAHYPDFLIRYRILYGSIKIVSLQILQYIHATNM